MRGGRKFVAFIPARGGSKGIIGKNLFPLNGKPLIQYTIESAMASSRLDYIFLSSDDPNIIEFCKPFGIDCDYVRPSELADDTAPMIDAVEHGLAWLESVRRLAFENLVLLQPTCPLRTADEIDRALLQFESCNADSLTSVSRMFEHPYECISGGQKDWSFLAHSAREVTRRQDFKDQFYFMNGAIYVRKISSLLSSRRFVEEGRTKLFEISQWSGIDIDTPFDMVMAEAALTHRRSLSAG